MEITLAANVKSTFMLSRAVIGHWLAHAEAGTRVRGTILNMASVLAFSPESKYFSTHAYAASKGAATALSKPWPIMRRSVSGLMSWLRGWFAHRRASRAQQDTGTRSS